MKVLSTNNLNDIKDLIQDELTKRGFHAQIVICNETESRRGGTYVEIESLPFQTTPVLFKEIKINNFGSWISEPNDDGCIEVQIEIHISYNVFGGGTNGTSLFSFRCEIYNDRIINRYIN